MFASPLSLILFAAVVLIVVSQTPLWRMARRALRRG